MNSKIFAVLVVISLIAVIPTAYAQLTIADKANQKKVEVEISLEGDVRVTHVIDNANMPKQVDLLPGTASNITVTDEEGQEETYTTVGANDAVLIMPSSGDSILQYDLDDAIAKVDGIWTWNFLYLETTRFVLPEEVDLLFVNRGPIVLNGDRAIACHGCQMTLEYSTDDPRAYEDVEWEDEKFLVEVRSQKGIEGFVFDQPSKSISFEVIGEDRIVTAIIPLELLWEPYTTFLNDEKIPARQHVSNGTHVWVVINPEASGQVNIIGTTVIPEFSMMIPLIMGFLVILALPFAKRLNLR